MYAERHEAEIGNGIDAPVGESIKSAPLPEFLSGLGKWFEQKFGQALAQGTTVKKRIQAILKMSTVGCDKLFAVVRTERIIDFVQSTSSSLTALMLFRDNSMAMGAIFFMANRKYPDLNNKVDSWKEIYLETKKGLIGCQKPKIAGLIHIKEVAGPAKKLIQIADVEKPKPGYQPDEETLSAAATYNKAAIYAILGKMAGKWIDSLEAFGAFPYEIARLVIHMNPPFVKQAGFDESDDEQIWLLPMGKYKELLECCLKRMEKNNLPDLKELYKKQL